MDTPTRPITIRLGETGESFDFDPPDALWLDMLAFCAVRQITVAQLIVLALEEGLALLNAGWGRA